MNEKRLVRKENDRVFLGVAGGLGQYFGIDPTWVRLGLAMGVLCSVGGLIPAYFVLALVMPTEGGGHGNGTYQPFSDEEIVIKDAV